MWETSTIWFEIAIVSGSIALGHIFLGHFEERSSKAIKFVKYASTLSLVIILSVFFGQNIALIVYGLLYLPVLYIHVIDLPKKGINGWSGEPKSKYYKLRGWDKDKFKKK